MMWLQSYGCATAAGDSAAELWAALLDGRDNARPWPRDPNVKAFQFKNRGESSIQNLLVEKLMLSWSRVKAELRRDESYGVILASTKGISDDFIWDPANPANFSDPLTPILQEFMRRAELQPKRSLCVSNACSSSLAALALSERWMAQGLQQVVIVAADAVTPFVVKGFQALKLISPTGVKSFAAERNGFYLGDAAACLLVTRERRDSSLRVAHVGLDSEGSAVTRPSSSGASLRQAALRIPDILTNRPHILIAHGTGTVINDETEDLAFSSLFSDGELPFITGTKWCVGHTLAASGAIDLIAAAEALRAQKIFKLETTDVADPRFRGRYLVKNSIPPVRFSRLMISSLGFGGMHASAVLETAQI
jgi:3-oxoacyl-[acyl-carrier-protein] synthase I